MSLLGGDPRPWLIAAEEPSARWVAITDLLDRPLRAPEAAAARRALLADPGTQRLLALLPDWEADRVLSGHNSPGFAPNLLNLLADMGVQAGDDERVERLLDAMSAHQFADGKLASYGRSRLSPKPIWTSLLCDAHAITEVLVRFGRAETPIVRAALDRMTADLATTPQGPAWACIPDAATGFRGPGRKGDICPQVTLEALRTFARLPERERPPELLAVARVSLQAWRVRGKEKPYMFGHGRGFKTVKWPTFWYDVHWVLDTLGRYPGLWEGPNADPDDRRAMAELGACMIAYNFDPNGRVTPRSCYRGFETFSFGQKQQPSPFATARLATVLRRLDVLTEDIRAVDVLRLGSSKGGTGTPVPPRTLVEPAVGFEPTT